MIHLNIEFNSLESIEKLGTKQTTHIHENWSAITLEASLACDWLLNMSLQHWLLLKSPGPSLNLFIMKHLFFLIKHLNYFVDSIVLSWGYSPFYSPWLCYKALTYRQVVSNQQNMWGRLLCTADFFIQSGLGRKNGLTRKVTLIQI